MRSQIALQIMAENVRYRTTGSRSFRLSRALMRKSIDENNLNTEEWHCKLSWSFQEYAHVEPLV